MKYKFLLFALVTLAFAQVPTTVTRLYTYYMIPGQTAWQWKSVVVDAPLKITLDTAGQAHLSVASPALCMTPSPDFFNAQPTYTMKNSKGTVFLNGVLQSVNIDYTLAGTIVTFKVPVDPGSTVQILYPTVCQ